MNESENRKQLQLSVVMILDIIALLVSCSAVSYIRNGQLMQGGRVISGPTTFLYILLVYILVSFFRNTKRDFFKRGFYLKMVDIIKEVTSILVIIDELPQFWNVLKGKMYIIRTSFEQHYERKNVMRRFDLACKCSL